MGPRYRCMPPLRGQPSSVRLSNEAMPHSSKARSGIRICSLGAGAP